MSRSIVWRRGLAQALAILLLLPATACRAQAPAFVPAQVAHGRLWTEKGVTILELTGDAAQRGEAAGRLLGAQLRWLLPRYGEALWGSPRLPPPLLRQLELLRPHQPAEHLRQLEAMARAAGVDRDALLAVQLSPELARGLACSCLGLQGERSATGRVLLARNLDWLGGELLGGMALVVVERGGPAPLVSLTWPGLVGVVTGINGAGLVAANLVANNRKNRLQVGVGVLFAQRRLLEEARSVEQALAVLRGMALALPQSYVLADPGALAAAEAGPGHFVLRRPSGGRLAVTNFWGEHEGAPHDGRYAQLVEAAAGKPLGVAQLTGVLGEVALGGRNLQAAVIDPAGMTVELALGPPPAARGPWVAVSVRGWLDGERD
ncbi:MAG: hypothetical protein FJ125_11890 [Deltaproteobacteria bacterium]|nr:hypothetical protein [Deltaproteobacteria bacterium]